ncbi:alanine aminotransferase 2-like isoform X2 [Coccinella septempunctata]|nr:alanine aminotransferase 2-like isoform X2 [Coccinella septempunctata]
MLRLNMGDAQSVGQPPINFLRQVMTLVAYPELIHKGIFPEDANIRAENILKNCAGGSVGSYSEVCGIKIIRRQIAKFIEEIDGVESQWENCYIGQGAGDMMKIFLAVIKFNENGLKAGVLTPVPGCTSYSMIIEGLDLQKIDYYLDEDNEWSININELQRAVDDAKTVCNPRAIVLINPGNPTGHILTVENMEAIVNFAFKENLIIIADEVYRTNILKANCNFIPFRRILKEMDKPYSKMELVTLMSMSDGIYAENGSRCGFCEIINLDPEIPPMIYRLLSISPPACNIAQAALYCLVNPPKPDEPSYEEYHNEIFRITDGFKASASLVEKTIKNLEGIKCNPLEGGIFFYPRLSLPENAVEKAKQLGLLPDEFYVSQLLQDTGICVVPGYELGQKQGTYHMRMTLISDPERERIIMQRFKTFHMEFMKKYTGFVKT